MVTKKEAKERTADPFVMPPTTDATIAAGIGQLGEQKELRVLANLRDDEAVITSIGMAWTDHLENPKKSFVKGCFANLTLYSAARSSKGALGRKQITMIAQAHAGSNVEAKEGKVARFLKSIGVKKD